MAFVNEYVSEENVKKYDLKGLWRRVTYSELPEGVQYTWTWDAERESFFIPMSSGREEYSNQKTGILYCNRNLWKVIISRNNGSVNFDEKPYKTTWGLVDIEQLSGEKESTERVLPILKDALIGYKAIGISILGDLDVETSFEF